MRKKARTRKTEEGKERVRVQSMIELLPVEIIFMILSRRELWRYAGILRCVCRAFRDVVGRTRTDHRVAIESVAMFEWSIINGYDRVEWNPIYEAVRVGRLDIVEWVSVNYGMCVHGMDKLPELVAERGDIKTLEWLRYGGLELNMDREYFLTRVCEGAATGGHIHVLEWAFQQNTVMRAMYDWSLMPATCGSWWAWALNKITDMCSGDILSFTCTTNAVGNKHYDALRWLISHGCHWEIFATEELIEAGDTSMVQWALDTGARFRELSSIAAGTNLEMLQWLASKGCMIHVRSMYIAAANGRIDILEWGLSVGYEFNNIIMEFGAEGGIEMVKWLVMKGCPPSSMAIADAARAGHLDVVEYLSSCGMTWPRDDLCDMALRHGHINVAEWAFERGGIVKGRNAVKYNKFEAVKWAVEHGCNTTDLVYEAMTCGHIKIAEWLLSNGCTVITERLCAYAAESGSIAAVKWAHARGGVYTTDVIKYAAREGHAELMSWAIKNGCPINWVSLYNTVRFNLNGKVTDEVRRITENLRANVYGSDVYQYRHYVPLTKAAEIRGLAEITCL